MTDLHPRILAALVAHHQQQSGECLCGWNSDGTHFEHVADQFRPIIDEAKKQARADIVGQVVEAIKVRREHHIAFGGDLRHTAGMYEAIRVAQQIDAVQPEEET